MENFLMTLLAIVLCILMLIIVFGLPLALIYYLIKKARK